MHVPYSYYPHPAYSRHLHCLVSQYWRSEGATVATDTVIARGVPGSAPCEPGCEPANRPDWSAILAMSAVIVEGSSPELGSRNLTITPVCLVRAGSQIPDGWGPTLDPAAIAAVEYELAGPDRYRDFKRRIESQGIRGRKYSESGCTKVYVYEVAAGEIIRTSWADREYFFMRLAEDGQLAIRENGPHVRPTSSGVSAGSCTRGGTSWNSGPNVDLLIKYGLEY